MSDNTQQPAAESKKKKSKLEIDADYDFVFLKNWSPVLRWLMVIPMGLFALLIVQFSFAFIFERFINSLNSEAIAIISNAIFTLMKYIMMIVAITATAPLRDKVKGAVVLCVFPLAMLGFGVWIISRHPEVASPTFVTAQVIAALLGLVWGVYDVKRNLQKSQSANSDPAQSENAPQQGR